MLTMIALEALIILVLVAINGILSMTELSILSSRKARLRTMADAGSKGAAIALELNESPERMLSTVQIGITLMGILSGVFGGATVSEVLTLLFVNSGLSESVAQPLAFGITVLTITYFSLVLGELVPKRIALHDPEAVAARLAYPVRQLSRLTSPFVTLLSISSRVVLKVLRISEKPSSSVSEEEVKLMIDEGTRSGVFEEAEKEMVGGIFRMSDLTVKDIMTPRIDIDWLDAQDSPDVLIDHVASSPHSIFPLGNGSVDDLLGVVKAKEFMLGVLRSSPFDVRSVAHTAVLVPEISTAFDTFKSLRQAGTPLAVVVDEYGGVEGIVTQTDLLSAIVGTKEEKAAAIVKRDDGSYLVDAALPIEELWLIVGNLVSDKDDQTHYRTVAGFVLDRFGHLPEVSESFVWNGYRFEVIDLDGRRIDKVLVSTLS